MRHFLILASLAFVTASYAEEGDFDFNGLIAKKALRDYKKAVAKDEKAQAQRVKEVEAEGANAAKTTRDAFVENLKKALKQSMQAGNLEEANKIDAAIKALKKRAERTTKVAYYDNGQKAWEVHYKNGKKDGPWTMWYENGKTELRGHYKDGKKEGFELGWGPNGQQRYESYFHKGKEVAFKSLLGM